MEKSEFQRLLDKYLNGNSSAEETKLLEQWFERIADPALDLSESEKAEIGKKMRRRHWENSRVTPHRKILTRITTYGIAAAVVMAIVAGAWQMYTTKSFISTGQKPMVASVEDSQFKNSTGKVKRVVLPDGSSVLLEPGSSIHHGAFTASKREVTLTGEGFFDVVKDPQRPFYVYGNDVVTKVLGTSFYVRFPVNSTTIEVEVKTGRVSVYKEQEALVNRDGSDGNGVILTPNQKVTYFIKEDQWVTALVENPEPVFNKDYATELVFDNEPLEQIIERLEKEYGIDIDPLNKKVTACTFTGDVTGLSLYDLLGVVTRSIGASFKKDGTKILIDGKGCD